MPPTDADVNVRLVENGHLELLREVRANQELFMRYGSGYVISETITDEDRERRRELEEARERERERATLARLEHEHVMGLGMYADLAPQRRAEPREARAIARERTVR